jgi:elongation factor G
MLFKETITQIAEGQARYLRLGAKDEYAEIKVRLTPSSRGSGVRLVPINTAFFPSVYFPGVEQGLISALATGPAGRYEVTDLEAEVTNGAYHAVDSSIHAFAQATAEAVRKALEAGHACLLEPLQSLRIETPQELTGALLTEVNIRGGEILGLETSHLEIEGMDFAIENVITASMPEREVPSMRKWITHALDDRVGFLTDPDGYGYLPESVARRMVYCAACERRILPAPPRTCPDCGLGLGSGDDFMSV